MRRGLLSLRHRCRLLGGGTGSGFVCATPVEGTPGQGNTCRAEWRGQYDGLRIYADTLDRWVSSRTIWSQHAYSVSHIEEDGTVVPTAQWTPKWKVAGLNNFRMNVQGETRPGSSPDLTAGQGLAPSCISEGVRLQVRVCNRGTQPVGVGLPVAFYAGASTPEHLLCTARTGAVIAPGECKHVGCTWSDPPRQGGQDVTVVADDDGTGSGRDTECVEGNNTAVIPAVFCPIVD